MATENLFPVEEYELDSLILNEEEQETERVGYKPSIYFDFKQGDFVRTGANRLVESSGFEAWQQWCIKCLHTQRYAHLAYSTDYGIDYKLVFNYTTRAEAENELTRQITEALEADPYQRLDHIESITYEWIDDTSVVVDLILVGISGNTIDLQTTLMESGINFGNSDYTPEVPIPPVPDDNILSTIRTAISAMIGGSY